MYLSDQKGKQQTFKPQTWTPVSEGYIDGISDLECKSGNFIFIFKGG